MERDDGVALQRQRILQFARLANDLVPGPQAEHVVEQPEVVEELADAYRRSLGSNRHQETPLSHAARNDFAFCFALGKQHDLAAPLFQQIGNRPAEYPWAYLGHPVSVFSRLRKSVT